jgi:hypothetical protein
MPVMGWQAHHEVGPMVFGNLDLGLTTIELDERDGAPTPAVRPATILGKRLVRRN